MAETPPPMDFSEVLKWLWTLLLLPIGMGWKRVIRNEDKAEKAIADLANRESEARNRIWSEHKGLEQRVNDTRETMATRADVDSLKNDVKAELHAVEKRLGEMIQKFGG